MGADVYLRSVSDEAERAWKPLFHLAVKARDADRLGANVKRRVIEEVKGRAAEVYASDLALSTRLMETIHLLGQKSRAERKEAMQTLVTLAYDQMNARGYYRDSYNQSNLLWRLGMNYWGYINELLDGSCLMSVANMRKLADDIKHATIIPTGQMEGDERLTGGAEEWDVYFLQKKADLLALMEQAIAKKEPLYWSV